MSETNTMTIHAFEVDLEKFAKVLDIAPKVVVRRLASDLHSRITKRTPVDTGRARASWDVKNGSASTFIPAIMIGKAAASATEGAGGKDVTGALAGITGLEPVYVTSALNYTQYLENGSSKQAPAGMVRISLAEIELEIEDLIDQLSP